MVYAQRDSNGRIVALYDSANENASEEVSINSEEVLEFLHREDMSDEKSKEILSRMDLEMVRITEDLITLLIDKGIIMFTDLPQAAQMKLMSRKKLRQHLNEVNPLLVNIEELF